MQISPMGMLMLAIVCELVATTALKLSDGLTKWAWSVVVVVGYGFTFYFLSLSLRGIPLGTAYAIWSGIGTVGTVIIGMLIWQEKLDAWRVLGIVLIVLGVLVLNYFAPSDAHSA